MGGSKKNANYFIGYQENNLFYMDPHNPQKYQPLNRLNENKVDEAKNGQTYFCDKLLKIKLTEEFNPSCAIGFLVNNQKKLDNLVEALIAE